VDARYGLEDDFLGCGGVAPTFVLGEPNLDGVLGLKAFLFFESSCVFLNGDVQGVEG